MIWAADSLFQKICWLLTFKRIAKFWKSQIKRWYMSLRKGEKYQKYSLMIGLKELFENSCKKTSNNYWQIITNWALVEEGDVSISDDVCRSLFDLTSCDVSELFCVFLDGRNKSVQQIKQKNKVHASPNIKKSWKKLEGKKQVRRNLAFSGSGSSCQNSSFVWSTAQDERLKQIEHKIDYSSGWTVIRVWKKVLQKIFGWTVIRVWKKVLLHCCGYYNYYQGQTFDHSLRTEANSWPYWHHVC